MKASSGTRWWEFYGIRYAMGTVVGAIVVLTISNQGGFTQSLLLQDKTPWTTDRIILLAAYGLTYCYLASAPILVLHATRFVDSGLLRFFYRTPPRFVFTVIIVFFIFIALSLFVPQTRYDNKAINVTFNSFNVLFVVVLPIFVFPLFQLQFIRTAFAQRREVFNRYLHLSAKRASAKTDIVESYRHLREHGNSFAIVIFELVLACVLISVNATVQRVIGSGHGHAQEVAVIVVDLAVLAIWIAPAALVWQLASNIESEFIDSENN